MSERAIRELAAIAQVPPYEKRIEAIGALSDAAEKGEDISVALPCLERIISDPDYESVDFDLYEDAAEALAHHYVNQRAWRDIAVLLEMRAAVRSGALSALRSAQARGREVDPALATLIPALSQASQRGDAEKILAQYLRDTPGPEPPGGRRRYGEGPVIFDQFGRPIDS